jgi:hypothetical protein
MLFDHCVITFPVPDGTEREPGLDACPPESWLRRRKLLRAVVAVSLILLIVVLLWVPIVRIFFIADRIPRLLSRGG